MIRAAAVAFVYGVLVLAGGLIGYLTAGSVASAIAGSAFGVLLLASGAAMLKDKVAGLYAALGLAAVLAAFFGYRFWVRGVFMPAGLMMILSLAAIVLFLTLRPRPA